MSKNKTFRVAFNICGHILIEARNEKEALRFYQDTSMADLARNGTIDEDDAEVLGEELNANTTEG